jgi:hypothetical protein
MTSYARTTRSNSESEADCPTHPNGCAARVFAILALCISRPGVSFIVATDSETMWILAPIIAETDLLEMAQGTRYLHANGRIVIRDFRDLIRDVES